MQLQKAARQKVKLRLSIASPTGFGKTASALILAHGMCNDWDKIAVIDTENKSASLYANHKLPNGYTIGEFQVIELEPPFTPEEYSKAIKLCEDSGIDVIIIDSVTHVWTGQGGLIESNNSLGQNTFQNWAKTTPRYQRWLGSILNSKCHVITTNRKKQAYALVDNNKGGKTVEKQGMEDQIRDGYDYEMTIAFEIINDKHLARAAKDRSSIFMDSPEFMITEETGRLIKDWCEQGIDAGRPLSSDPMLFETTMHNHKELGTVDKPLIPNKALKDACARLEKGELLAKDGSQLYDKLLDTYTFEATQRTTLDAAWQKGCIAADKLQEVADGTN